MGKSAKLRKRIASVPRPRRRPTLIRAQKKTSSSSTPAPAQASAPPVHAQSAKKRADLKAKAKARTKGGHVLGGADYVTLMLGGRRKAADEAAKLPPAE